MCILHGQDIKLYLTGSWDWLSCAYRMYGGHVIGLCRAVSDTSDLSTDHLKWQCDLAVSVLYFFHSPVRRWMYLLLPPYCTCWNQNKALNKPILVGGPSLPQLRLPHSSLQSRPAFAVVYWVAVLQKQPSGARVEELITVGTSWGGGKVLSLPSSFLLQESDARGEVSHAWIIIQHL